MQCDGDTLFYTSSCLHFNTYLLLFVGRQKGDSPKIHLHQQQRSQTFRVEYIEWSRRTNLTTRIHWWGNSLVVCVADHIFFVVWRIVNIGRWRGMKYIKCAKYLFDKWSKEIDFYSFEYGLWFAICILVSDSDPEFDSSLAICVQYLFEIQQQQQLSVSRDVFDLWYFL